MEGAVAPTAGTSPPGTGERPEPIKAIPVRHWGRWIAAAVIIYLAVALAWSLAHNENVGWATIGEYLFKPLTLRGVLVTIEMTAIAMVIGLVGGFACLWGVHGLKKLLGADDSLDVFGVHGVGGIVGALLTGVFNSPALGGPGYVADWVTASMVTAADYSIAAQVWTQAKAVLLTVVWSGVVSVIAFKLVDLMVGLRVSEEDEREGLDITSHGETAYSR